MLQAIWRLVTEVYDNWWEDDIFSLTAALSYYTAVSIAPLLIIVIAIAGAVFSQEAARGEIVTQIDGLIGREGAKAVEVVIENANQPAEFTHVYAQRYGSGVQPQLYATVEEEAPQ